MIYRSKSGGVKRWAKMLTTAVLAFVLAIVVFASTAFAGLLNEYNVDIVVDGVTTTVTTREEKPTEILTNANITLESTDKLDQALKPARAARSCWTGSILSMWK